MTAEVDHDHPYSEAVRRGAFVFASGSLPLDEQGGIVGGRRPALDAALRTLERRLASAGAGLDEVVSLTYFVTDISLRDEANDQFVEAFRDPRPARNFVGVADLPYEATVEITAIAVADRVVEPPRSAVSEGKQTSVRRESSAT